MFAYTKGAIWSRKSKMNRQLKTMIYKTIHRKLMIEQHESYLWMDLTTMTVAEYNGRIWLKIKMTLIWLQCMNLTTMIVPIVEQELPTLPEHMNLPPRTL
jgi:hypothetical protein